GRLHLLHLVAPGGRCTAGTLPRAFGEAPDVLLLQLQHAGGVSGELRGGAVQEHPVARGVRLRALMLELLVRQFTGRTTQRGGHSSATIGVSIPTGPSLCAPPGAPSGSSRPGRTDSKNSRLFAMNASSSSGTRRSWLIASTGHTGSQAPQSMHSLGLM